MKLILEDSFCCLICALSDFYTGMWAKQNCFVLVWKGVGKGFEKTNDFRVLNIEMSH